MEELQRCGKRLGSKAFIKPPSIVQSERLHQNCHLWNSISPSIKQLNQTTLPSINFMSSEIFPNNFSTNQQRRSPPSVLLQELIKTSSEGPFYLFYSPINYLIFFSPIVNNPPLSCPSHFSAIIKIWLPILLGLQYVGSSTMFTSILLHPILATWKCSHPPSSTGCIFPSLNGSLSPHLYRKRMNANTLFTFVSMGMK